MLSGMEIQLIRNMSGLAAKCLLLWHSRVINHTLQKIEKHIIMLHYGIHNITGNSFFTRHCNCNQDSSGSGH